MLIPFNPPSGSRRGLRAARRTMLAVLSSTCLVAAGLALTPSPAEAQTCQFDTFRIHHSGHQQRTVENFGCSQVAARHWWCVSSVCSGPTIWVWHPTDAASPYKEVYSFGQGAGQT